MLAAFGAIAIAVCVAFAAGIQWVVWPSVQHVELHSVQRDVDRLRYALDEDLSDLAELARDWANWDQTYAFLADGDPAYLAANVGYDAFRHANLDLIAFLDASWRQVWAGQREADRLTPVSPALLAPLRAVTAGEQEERTGILMTPLGPLLFALAAVRDNAGTAPPRGVLVMGRRLDTAALAQLRDRLKLQTLESAIVPPARAAAAEDSWQELGATWYLFEPAIKVEHDPLYAPIITADWRQATLYVPLAGADESLALWFLFPRHISDMARSEISSLAAVTIGAMLAFIAVGMLIMEFGVVRPLRGLMFALRDLDAGRVGLPARYVSRDDEIGALGRRIDAMHRSVVAAAHQDTLTGLYNRRWLDTRFEDGGGQVWCFCYLDLDGFKQVNDTHGHDIGDEVLREVSLRIVDILRRGDSCVRLGGDEFLLVLGGLHRRTDVAAILGRVLNAIEAIETVRGRPVLISASVGVAFFRADGTDPGEAIQRADSAMYAAKRSRSGIVFADKDAAEMA